tara:strand:+ start:177 stop:3902 length:3726 start_codon:yes stop_codon:yes gene_type:complete
VQPFASEFLQNPLPQGERFELPSKGDGEEWYDWFKKVTESDSISNLDFDEIRINWDTLNDYHARIWLQMEYEQFCRGTKSIRMVKGALRERDAELASDTLNILTDRFVEIIIQVWNSEEMSADRASHIEVSRLKIISKLSYDIPDPSECLRKSLKLYARETIRAILQSAKFSDKDEPAKFKAGEFIQNLGIRFSAITDANISRIKLRLEPKDSDQMCCTECGETLLNFPDDNGWCVDCYRIGASKKEGDQGYKRNTQWVDEKLAYNFLLLLLDNMWLEVHPGTFDDIVTISQQSDDEITKSKFSYPNVLYLSLQFYEMIHENRDRDEFTKNIHAVFRWFSVNRDRWCYAEPEDHYWEHKAIPEPKELGDLVTDDELFDYDFLSTRHKNQGVAWPRGYLTKDENTGHHKLRYVISNQEKFEPLGKGRIKGTLSKQNVTALNNLQKTQWEVNLDFLEAISTVQFDEKTERQFIQLKEEIILPPDKENQERWVDRLLSDYIPKILKFSQNVFWQVWSCDFRGRMAPRCTVLSPQQSDMDRALLRFKEWKTLGDRGWYWLRIHLFNLIAGIEIFGAKPSSKKLSFDKRAEWVEEHITDYLNIAAYPIKHHQEWQEKPRPKGESLQRLASILEVARVWNLHKQGQSWDEISSGLPIQLDASINGYQHISALLRNEKLAKSVNVIPDPEIINTDNPVRDLYRQVSEYARENWDACTSELSQGFSDDARFSGTKVDKIFTRKFSKNITMTLAYGAVDISRIYSGNKSKKLDYKKRIFIHAGEEKTDSNEQIFVCAESNQKFNNFDAFEKHIRSEGPRIPKRCIIEPIFDNQIPDSPPSWASIKEGYDDPENRAFIHLRNLNVNQKSKDKPEIYNNWFALWHEKSLLRSVFNENEFNSEEQMTIATALSKDYKKAVEDVTQNAMQVSGKMLKESISNSRHNILRWTVPTGFTCRNFYPYLETKDMGWSSRKGGLWNQYWGKTAMIKERGKSHIKTFEEIETLLGKATDINQLILDAFKKGSSLEALENLFLRIGIKRNDLPQFMQAPWDQSKQVGEDFMIKLDEEFTKNKNNSRIIKTCLINYLNEGRLNPLRQAGTIDMKGSTHYRKIRHSLLGTISYNPARYLPDITEIVNGESVPRKYCLKKGQNQVVGTFKTKITPNYIHSMDAAHMAMTINKMFSEHEIHDFWAVHDCFGVHASDTDTLVEVVRETFHEIYSERTIANVGGNSFEKPEDAFDADQILQSRYLIG